ncbi:hypothetical protein PAN31117_00456 [Pandoraea anapnoica]|uniref:Uncharacterized protein n=1 Tax=Pandoraea anapnoica TaxID=2508301 RepID=A0A5E4ZIW4_9BURK|nr:hypothetical protein PAN31117_00456 [Pandoraea anapnoica]
MKRGRDVHPGAVAHEQLPPKLVFQTPDLLTHGRLRAMHTLRRTRETTFVDDRNECLE